MFITFRHISPSLLSSIIPHLLQAVISSRPLARILMIKKNRSADTAAPQSLRGISTASEWTGGQGLSPANSSHNWHPIPSWGVKRHFNQTCWTVKEYKWKYNLNSSLLLFSPSPLFFFQGCMWINILTKKPFSITERGFFCNWGQLNLINVMPQVHKDADWIFWSQNCYWPHEGRLPFLPNLWYLVWSTNNFSSNSYALQINCCGSHCCIVGCLKQ